MKILNKFGINVVTHIMVGLPKENFEDIKNTVKFLNMHNIQGIKVHSCYVLEGTPLAVLYKKGDYTPILLSDYLECLTYIITHISPDVVIHRISGDAPKDLLLAPSWNIHKKWVLNGFEKIMNSKNLWQGKFYTK